MNLTKRHYCILIAIAAMLFIGCNTRHNEKVRVLDYKPVIDPDYSGVIIPPNIAPMNFFIEEDGIFFKVEATSQNIMLQVTSTDGIIQFPEKSWKELISDCKGDTLKIQIYSSDKDENSLKKYKPIFIYVANEPIDPYLVYRLIYPGYHSWSDMKIIQRSLESFKEISLIDNQLLDKNCINCHAFNQNDPDKFLLHIRGSKGGTYFVENGNITKTKLSTENVPAGATYPAWYPNGDYVVFSSNFVTQSFYAHSDKDIEVYDFSSSLVIYDITNNELISIREHDTIEYLETFPSWSPEGKYLYYCRAKQVEEDINARNIKNIQYNLVRNAFNPEIRSFGKTEIVFDASKMNKSASFPKVSPDGQNLVFTLHDYGTFPIWHKEADLYLLNLQTGTHSKMNINSNEAESYHTWSSNGNWLVFSSKRRDGRSAIPYFSYFRSPDSIGKPFVLPQKDPSIYNKMLKTFNLPEFVTGRIKVSPRDFERAAKQKSLEAGCGNPIDIQHN